MLRHSWNRYESLTKSKSLFPHFDWPEEMKEKDTMYQTQSETGSGEDEEALLARTRRAVNQILTASKGHTCKWKHGETHIRTRKADRESSRQKDTDGRHKCDLPLRGVERSVGSFGRAGATSRRRGDERVGGQGSGDTRGLDVSNGKLGRTCIVGRILEDTLLHG